MRFFRIAAGKGLDFAENIFPKINIFLREIATKKVRADHTLIFRVIRVDCVRYHLYKDFLSLWFLNRPSDSIRI